MKILFFVIAYVITYIFGAFTFPQIVGSIRMIKMGFTRPYVFTLILWSTIFVIVTLLVYLYLPNYLPVYLVALILPLIFTLRTDKIE